MITNQMMEVKIGQYGVVHIGHQDMIGNLRHVLEIGNNIRESKGLEPKSLQSFFRKESTWEYVIKLCNERENELRDTTQKSILYNTIKDLPKDSKNQINESEIFKTHYFDDIVFKRNRGKLVNRGIWGHLYLLLDLALWLDVDLKHQVYKTFVEGKILNWRDVGGDSFKQLNISIDTRLPTSKGVSQNTHLYYEIANKIRDKIGYHNDWNQATKEQLEKRDKILSSLVSFLEMDLIKDDTHLFKTIKHIGTIL